MAQSEKKAKSKQQPKSKSSKPHELGRQSRARVNEHETWTSSFPRHRYPESMCLTIETNIQMAYTRRHHFRGFRVEGETWEACRVLDFEACNDQETTTGHHQPSGDYKDTDHQKTTRDEHCDPRDHHETTRTLRKCTGAWSTTPEIPPSTGGIQKQSRESLSGAAHTCFSPSAGGIKKNTRIRFKVVDIQNEVHVTMFPNGSRARVRSDSDSSVNNGTSAKTMHHSAAGDVRRERPV